MDDLVEAEELPSYAGIRPLALAVFRDGSRILVEDNAAWDRRDWFYRPPGGGVEFGERAADALRREMREEFNAEVTDVRLLGTLESIFDYHGQARPRGRVRLRRAVCRRFPSTQPNGSWVRRAAGFGSRPFGSISRSRWIDRCIRMGCWSC